MGRRLLRLVRRFEQERRLQRRRQRESEEIIDMDISFSMTANLGGRINLQHVDGSNGKTNALIPFSPRTAVANGQRTRECL